MVVESSQLASTAHRVLDGKLQLFPYFNKKENKVKVKKHFMMEGETAFVQETQEPDEDGELQYVYRLKHSNPLYKASHFKHPSELWLQRSSGNYLWHIEFLRALFDEYTFRYGKVHSSESIFDLIKELPKNLPIGERTPFALAMPEEYKVEDAIQSYQNYYVGAKTPFARWTNVEVPRWFLERTKGLYDEAHFARTR